jgi:quinol monooxygenase YgiN
VNQAFAHYLALSASLWSSDCYSFGMVSLVFWLKTRRRDSRTVALALQSVLQPAQLDRDCIRCGLTVAVDAPGQFFYYEEWTSEEQLCCQLRSDRFRQMLALMEAAVEPPVLEIRLVNEVRGLEYVKSLRSEQMQT